MFILFITLWTVISTVSGRTETLSVKASSCGRKFDLRKNHNIEFVYGGRPIDNVCRLKIENSDFASDNCVKITQKGRLCAVEMEYHSLMYTSIPDRTVDCQSLNLYDEYCTTSSTLEVVLKNPINSGQSPLKFKVYLKENGLTSFADVPLVVKNSIYLVIGIVIGGIVLVTISCIVCIVCCCKRRQSSGGTVYRSPQMAAATTMQASYPQQQVSQQQQHYPPQQTGYQPPPQAGYQPAGYPQPPQAGYQPPPQGGYQPPPQGRYQPPQQGYQPPPGGYPPAPQQGYAGYQTSPPPSLSSEKPPLASAPPMSEVYPMQDMAPPPYPGN